MPTEPQDVIVSNPGRNHSHQTALALQAAGRLAGYWSGIPSRPSTFPAPFKAIARRLRRYADVDCRQANATHSWRFR